MGRENHKFLDGVNTELLTPLSAIDVELYVKGLVDRRLEPDKQLAIEVTRNWSEIASGRFQYDRLQAEVGALLSVTKQDIVEFWNNLYVKERRMLISEIVPKIGPVSKKVPLRSSGYVGGVSKNRKESLEFPLKSQEFSVLSSTPPVPKQKGGEKKKKEKEERHVSGKESGTDSALTSENNTMMWCIPAAVTINDIVFVWCPQLQSGVMTVCYPALCYRCCVSMLISACSFLHDKRLPRLGARLYAIVSFLISTR